MRLLEGICFFFTFDENSCRILKRFLLTLLFSIIYQLTQAAIPFKIEYAKLPLATWPLSAKNLFYKPFDSDLPQPHSAGSFVFKVTPLAYTSPKKNYVIYFPTEHLSSIRLCRLQNATLIPLKSAGNNHHDSSTPWGYPRFILKGGQKTYYLETSFKKGVYFPVQLMPEPEFRRFEVKGNFGLGMFYGLAAVIFIMNALFFIFFRQCIFAYYGLFQAFIVTSIASSDGLFTFFTDNPYFLTYADIPLHIGIFVTGFFFAGQFMGWPEAFNRMKFVVILAVVCSATSMMLYMSSGEMLFYILAESIALLMLCSYWVIALMHFKTNKNACLYVLAYSLYLFFAVEYYIARQIGLPGVRLFSGQLKISCVTEMIVLLIGIIYRAITVLHENRYFRKKIESYIQEKSDKQKLDLQVLRVKYNLTEREAEVLSYMVHGMSNPEIAEKMFVSVNTIKYHIRNIFVKMEINSRSEAISKVQFS